MLQNISTYFQCGGGHNVTHLTDFNPDLKVEKKVFYVRSRAQTFFFLNDRKFRCRPDKKKIKPAKWRH